MHGKSASSGYPGKVNRLMKLGEHAKMFVALAGPSENMGPNTKALYERFMEQPDEECIAAESQVVYLFQNALHRDLQGLPLPSEED